MERLWYGMLSLHQFLSCSPSVQLRAAVADIPDKPEDDDYFYLRWLRARKFKVRKAEEMLRKVRRC